MHCCEVADLESANGRVNDSNVSGLRVDPPAELLVR